MSPDIIEEWYHVKTGKESPISAKGLSPSDYLTKLFGNADHLPELKRYHDEVKFDADNWIDIALGVLQFLPVTKWIGISAKVIGSVLWPVLKKLRN